MPQGYGAIGLAFGALLSALGATYFWSPWLACVGLVLLMGSFLGSHDGESSWRNVGLLEIWPACWLLIRLPLNLDLALTNWLQSVTSQAASVILEFQQIPHRLTGNVFYLPGGSLFVEEACSGVQSVFALLFCALLLFAWIGRSPCLIPVYMILAIAWAGVMNIVRIVSIAVAQEWYGLDLAHGFRHELLGYVCLAIAILLLASSDRLLRVLFFPVPSADDMRENPLEIIWNRLFYQMASVIENRRGTDDQVAKISVTWIVKPMVLVSVLCCVSQVAMAIVQLDRSKGKIGVAWKPSSESLLNDIEGVQVFGRQIFSDGSNPSLGQHAVVWRCLIQKVPTSVVVSQHVEFHDLCNCYQGNGFELLTRKLMEKEKWHWVQAEFRNAEFTFGHLLFSSLSGSGTPIRPGEIGFAASLSGRFPSSDSHQETFNIQLWSDSDTPFSDEQKDALKRCFLEIRNVIRSDLEVAL